MVFRIRADFLLGTYQGHDRHGIVERFPSPLRLHAALVAGSYALSRLDSEGDGDQDKATELDPRSSAALEWFETNTPSAISLPRAVINDGGDARAYRDKGGSGGKKASEPTVNQSAIDGPVIWWWESEPAPAVQEALSAICLEVPYLGESASPVTLSAESVPTIDTAAYVRSLEGGFSASETVTFVAPQPGRSAALERDHRARIGARIPTESQDSALTTDGRPRANETERPDPWNDSAVVRSVSYVRPRSKHTDDSPWTGGILIHVTPRSSRVVWPPAPEDRVAWAVALHRAIVSRLGPDAPVLVTGRYPKSQVQPPNRLSIQLVDGGMDLTLGLRPSEAAFLLAFPRGAHEEDIDLVLDAAHTIKDVITTGGRAVTVDFLELVDTSLLWTPLAPGFTRWWFPHPLVVADSRSPRKSALDGRTWTIEDTLRVAVGNVFRDLPPLHVAGRGDARIVGLSSAVDALGVRVGAAHRAYPLRPSRYVHHMNPGATIIATQGLIHLGRIRAERSFMAIGQSRHLGGGLLVPFDLPKAIIDNDADLEEGPDREQ